MPGARKAVSTSRPRRRSARAGAGRSRNGPGGRSPDLARGPGASRPGAGAAGRRRNGGGGKPWSISPRVVATQGLRSLPRGPRWRHAAAPSRGSCSNRRSRRWCRAPRPPLAPAGPRRRSSRRRRQAASENSPRTLAAAQSKSRRRYSTSKRADASARRPGAPPAAGPRRCRPSPRTCLRWAWRRLIVRLRAIRKSQRAERPPRRVGVEPADGRGHRPEDLLRQVGRVGVLQPAPPAQPFDQRAVDRQELGPGPLVARVAQPDQQARPRARRVVHPSSPGEITGLTARS